MKLPKEKVEYIRDVINVAQLVGVESLIYEQGMVRGMHEDRIAAIIQNENVPPLFDDNPEIAMGLSRLSFLNTRLNMVFDQETFSAEAVTKEKDDAKYVFSLTLKAKGVKIDYRCADPSRIQAKKTINDPLQYSVPISPEFVNMLSKGISAMGSANVVTLISNEEGVSFEIADDEKDVFQHVFAESVEVIDPQVTTTKFAHRYPAKLLLSVVKKNPEGILKIGSVGLGVLRFDVQGIGVYLPPRA